MSDYQETLYDGYGQRLRMDQVLHQDPRLTIFENARMGRVMALDGVIQTSEADAFIYQEMLAHVPILAHGLARRVLIVGGADGGVLRQVAKHRDVERITLVEGDGGLVDLCRKFLPNHAKGAFEDPRLNLVIDHGLNYLATCTDKFDLIICDAGDPTGPGQALYAEPFYQACRRCLDDGGILVARSGVPFLQLTQVQASAAHLHGLFADWHFYLTAVPSCIGGSLAFAWGATDAAARKLPLETLRQRFAGSGILTRYYNPEVHLGAFALPQYLLQAINKPSND